MPFPDFEGEQISAALTNLLRRTDIDNVRGGAQDRVHATITPGIDGVEVVEVPEIFAIAINSVDSL